MGSRTSQTVPLLAHLTERMCNYAFIVHESDQVFIGGCHSPRGMDSRNWRPLMGSLTSQTLPWVAIQARDGTPGGLSVSIGEAVAELGAPRCSSESREAAAAFEVGVACEWGLSMEACLPPPPVSPEPARMLGLQRKPAERMLLAAVPPGEAEAAAPGVRGLKKADASPKPVCALGLPHDPDCMPLRAAPLEVLALGRSEAEAEANAVEARGVIGPDADLE